MAINSSMSVNPAAEPYVFFMDVVPSRSCWKGMGLTAINLRLGLIEVERNLSPTGGGFGPLFPSRLHDPHGLVPWVKEVERMAGARSVKPDSPMAQGHGGLSD